MCRTKKGKGDCFFYPTITISCLAATLLVALPEEGPMALNTEKDSTKIVANWLINLQSSRSGN